MFIDTYVKNWFDDLISRAETTSSPDRTYLLVDGVFVPGLHRKFGNRAKSLLFESLPGCTEDTRDVSPFLIPYDPADKTLRSHLRRCDRWPMISAIQTPESMEKLSARLAAWCVVEADGQRFNFRFPDTRRLPAIYKTLTTAQRGQIAGPAVHWWFIARDGNWAELALDGAGIEVATDPQLDQHQFAALVDDSRIDELLTLLHDWGHETYRHPSRSHALLGIALRVAHQARLEADEVPNWCEWFWQNDQLHDDPSAAQMLTTWKEKQCLSKT